MKKFFFFVGIVMTLLLTGCKSYEQIVYMQDVPMADSTFTIQAAQNIRIRPGDKLSIIVNTSIPDMAPTFNLSVPFRYVGGVATSNSQSQTAFYVVDDKGEIDFPVLGKLKVEGLSRQAIASMIKDRLVSENLLKDAIVSVDYGNLSFSVLGEVNSPGRYIFDKDRINILEAISMANDLTIMGKRDNILVTRTDEGGQQKTFRVDLRDTKSLFSSPVYYVQQNDIIYVEPNSTRARQSTVSGNTVLTPSFWISAASLITTIVALIIR